MSLVVLVVMVISRGPGVIGSFILIRVNILVVGARVMARSSTWISFVVNITLFKVEKFYMDLFRCQHNPV